MKKVSRFQLTKGSVLDPRAVQQSHDDAVAALNIITGKPLVGAVLLEDIVLTAGQITKIPHGLGRPVTNYIIVCTNAALDLPINQKAQNPRPNQELWLQSSATATVNLVVF